jgi:hypothetical protein
LAVPRPPAEQAARREAASDTGTAGQAAKPAIPVPTASTPAANDGPAAAGDDSPAAAADEQQPSLEVTVVPGITRYHRDDCILIRFLSDDDLERMTREAAVAADCVPCKACQPDTALAGA